MIRKRTLLEREVDRELISKGKDALKDFDESQAFYVPGKKRESKLISIRLPMDMIHKLREIANRRGDVGYQSLIKIYLADSLKREDEIKKHGWFIYVPDSAKTTGQYIPITNVQVRS